LDGRYWYVAKGKKAVERHFEEMGDLSKLELENGEGGVNSWKMIRRIEKRCKEEKEAEMLPGKKEERQIKKALGVIDLTQKYVAGLSLSLHSDSIKLTNIAHRIALNLSHRSLPSTQPLFSDSMLTFSASIPPSSPRSHSSRKPTPTVLKPNSSLQSSLDSPMAVRSSSAREWLVHSVE
jgi:hypothetical protein